MPNKKQQLVASGRESDMLSHVTDQEESIGFKSVPISETYDDLKAEFFNYVTVECMFNIVYWYLALYHVKIILCVCINCFYYCFLTHVDVMIGSKSAVKSKVIVLKCRMD